MTNLTDLQRSALDIITMHPFGRPITGKELEGRIGIKPNNRRQGADLRSVIHALRMKGYPVCAYGRGYWWPADGDELKAYILSLEARAREVQEAADGLKQGYSLVGQAKGQEQVKLATKVRFRAKKGGILTMFEVMEHNVGDFLAKYPDAERHHE